MARHVPPRDPARFDLDAYDARCLALHDRLVRLARPRDQGTRVPPRSAAGDPGTGPGHAQEARDLVRDLGDHFARAFAALGLEPREARDALEGFERLTARAAQASPAAPTPSGVAASGVAAEAAALFREANALVYARLDGPARQRVERSRRALRRGLAALLGLAALALALLLAAPALDAARRDLLRDNFVHDFVRDPSDRPGLRIAGIYGPESAGGRSWRWGWGTRTIIALELASPRDVRLDYRVSNPMAGQDLSVAVNGEVLARHPALPGVTDLAPSAEGSVRFRGRKGLNAVVIEHPLVNHFTFTGDDTPYSVAFLELKLAAGWGAWR